MQGKALVANALYTRVECRGGRGVQAEAIAQARAIASFNSKPALSGGATDPGKISSHIQWEVRGPHGRVDILVYDPDDSSGDIQIVELKQVEYGGLPAARAQISRYVQGFPRGSANRRVAPMPFVEGYGDAYRVLLADCPSAPRQLVRQFRVDSVPGVPGVLLISHTDRARPCPADGTPLPVDEHEPVPEDHDVPTDVPLVYPFPGNDKDNNGNQDFWERFLEDHSELDEFTVPAVGGVRDTVAVNAQLLAAVAVVLANLTTELAQEAAQALGDLIRVNGELTEAMVIAWATDVTDSLFGPANVYGDPHLVTLDGRGYTMQAVGEFHALEVPHDDIDVQVRFAPAIVPDVSALSRVATEIDGDVVQLGGGHTLLNGEDLGAAAGGLTWLGDGGLLVQHAASSLVFWPIGDDPMAMRLRGSTLSFAAPETLESVGLFGNRNGDVTDDLARADGTPLGTSPTPEELHGPFADSWRITDEESLFSYAPGESTVTYTDLSFPDSVVTLADFTTAEIQAATEVCMDRDVQPGPQFHNCVYDVAVTGDEAYAAAAADVTGPIVDPAAATFDEQLDLDIDFESPVPTNFRATSYRTDPATSTAAGPLFDATGYSFYLRDMPRHNTTSLSMTLLTYGSATTPTGQAVDVVLNRKKLASINLDDPTDPLSTGPVPAAVTPTGTGTTQAGTPFHRYRVELVVADATPYADFEFQFTGFSGVLNTSAAVDDIQLHLTATPAHTFTASVPFTTADLPSAASTVTTAGDQNEYHFTLDQPALDGLVISSPDDCLSGLRFLLVDDNGTVLNNQASCWPDQTDPLPAGDYAILATGAAGTYDLAVQETPGPQVFTYTLGEEVGPGQPQPGAGNLETSVSIDRYDFTLTADLDVVFDHIDGTKYYTLTNTSTDEEVGGGVMSDKRYHLSAGTYRLEVDASKNLFTGEYAFRIYPAPVPQVFAYTPGTKVTDGIPAAGAGNLEIAGSVDRYTFTAGAGGRSYKYEPLDFTWKKANVVEAASGTVVASLSSTARITVPAGNYYLEFKDQPGTYSFRLTEVPEPQEFPYVLNTTVSNGSPWAGAGNIETSASLDRYYFTIDAPGLKVQFDWLAGWRTFVLTNLDTGEKHDTYATDKQWQLSPGRYALDVGDQAAGTYSFNIFEVPAPQDFGYSLDTLVSNGTPWAGAGNLETIASVDRYHFSVAEPGMEVQFDWKSGYKFFRLIHLDTGQEREISFTDTRLELAPGEYTLQVGNQSAGTYSFNLFEVPDPQTFDYVIGSTVADGVPAPGAGNLETIASVDTYRFTVPTGFHTVRYSNKRITTFRNYRIVDATGTEVGSGYGTDHDWELPPGDYQLIFDFTSASQQTGTYSFALYLVPDPQTFAYTFGTTVSDGVPWAGAGNLETPQSVDQYDFTVPDGGLSLKYDWQNGSKHLTLTNTADGSAIRALVAGGDSTFTLPAGNYRLTASATSAGTYSFTLLNMGPSVSQRSAARK